MWPVVQEAIRRQPGAELRDEAVQVDEGAEVSRKKKPPPGEYDAISQAINTIKREMVRISKENTRLREEVERLAKQLEGKQ